MLKCKVLAKYLEDDGSIWLSVEVLTEQKGRPAVFTFKAYQQNEYACYPLNSAYMVEVGDILQFRMSVLV